MEAQGKTSLNGHGIFAVIVFAVVALICIQPLHIPLPLAVSKVLANTKKWRGDNKAARNVRVDRNGEGPSSTPNAHKIARQYITLNHVWTPTIGILFLLATKTIGGEQIKLGIVGEHGIEPYDVLSLFISLAYIAISLDATGLLRYLAFQVCQRAGSNGFTLYFILYAFFWVLGVVVGNDPVILSGTAFLVHLTRVAGISPPSAWIWAQFVAANISSAVLVSSNPTNLVIASGFGISFPVYTAYMILPAFVSAFVSLGTLLLFFRNRKQPKGETNRISTAFKVLSGWTRKAGLNLPSSRLRARNTYGKGGPPRMEAESGIELSSIPAAGPTGTTDGETERRTPLIFIPASIVRPDVDAREALVDAKGAIFNSLIMAATLITLVVTSIFGGVKVYMIAAPGAGICLIRDAAYDWYTWRSVRKKKLQKQDAEQSSTPETPQNAAEDEPGAAEAITPSTSQSVRPQLTRERLLSRVLDSLKHLSTVFPTVAYVFNRLPFPLLPFAFGMFILVQSLAFVGFIDIMASGLGRICAAGPVGCSFFMSILAVILCNLGGTNIGATILLTKALQSTAFQSLLDPSQASLITRTAYFSVAFGSNVGAMGGTFAASLAGLLWRDVLRQRGVVVTKLQFLLWSSIIILPALLSGTAIVLMEVKYFVL